MSNMSNVILDVSSLIPYRSYRLLANCGYFVRDVQFLGLESSGVPGVMLAKFYDASKKEYHYINNNDIWRNDNPVHICAI